MHRRDFITRSCVACLSGTALSFLGSSCASTQYVRGKLGTNGITLTKEDFLIRQGGSTAYSSFIIVRNDALKYGVCVYRFSENEYTALWMRCTHQGAALQAAGDVLQCAAHGSEFTNKGEIRNGPADLPLKTFPVTVTNNEIFIDLRKQS